VPCLRLLVDGLSRRIRSQVSSCEIYGKQRFLSEYFGQYHSTNAPYSSHLYVAVTKRTNGRSLRTFEKARLFRKSWSIAKKKLSIFHLVFKVDILLRMQKGHLSNTQVTALKAPSGFPLWTSTCWQPVVSYQQLRETECRQTQAVMVAALFKVTVRFAAVATLERFCSVKWVARNLNPLNAIKQSKYSAINKYESLLS
jgi:hypothetical protein